LAGIVVLVLIAIVYEQPVLLAVLVPLIPTALAFFFTRDVAAKVAEQTVKEAK
jgi:hypothetical protein